MYAWNHTICSRVYGPVLQTSVGQLSKMYSYMLVSAVAFPVAFSVYENIL